MTKHKLVCLFLYLILWSDEGFSRIVHTHKNSILSSKYDQDDGLIHYVKDSQKENVNSRNHTMRFQKSKAKEPLTIGALAVTIGTMWAIGAAVTIVSTVVGEFYDYYMRRKYVEKLRKDLAASMWDQKAQMCSPFLDVFRGMFERIKVHNDGSTRGEKIREKILGEASDQLCSALKQYKEDHFKRALHSCFTTDAEGQVFSLEKYYKLQCADSEERIAQEQEEQDRKAEANAQTDR